jgi:hypothetical protein
MTAGKYHIGIILIGKKDGILPYCYKQMGEEFEKLGCKVTYFEAEDQLSDLDIERICNDPSLDALLDHNLFLHKTSKNFFRKSPDLFLIEWMDIIYNKLELYYSVPPVKTLFLLAERGLFSYTQEVVSKNNSEKAMIFHLPVAAFTREPFSAGDIEKRRYDVLYFGRLGFDKDNFDEFNRLERKLVPYFQRRTFIPGKKQMHEFVQPVMKWFRFLGLYKRGLIDPVFANYVWKLSHTIRTRRRLFTLDELFSLAGTRQLIITDDNNKVIPSDTRARIDSLSFQPWEKILHCISDSKVIVNNLPFHTYGMHERILCAMAQGCVVFSDRNELLEEKFKDGTDIVYFDYKKGDLRDKLDFYLSRPEELRNIAVNAHEKVMKTELPYNRAVSIIAFLDKARKAEQVS